ncbi:hypothetical protein N7474_001696 [Penicillium riverlandense]|uniref:uncharacterized protein n=1 Tax=Penicillium riverlandense TaxID=1903569 RepID=UPI00254808CF|nr:uncharacterized protein N7474_001696 [Penicillium riverlandense]KAJ5833385.1 hypothetical protein N7474_001696 [Penicillium riverlandense]
MRLSVWWTLYGTDTWSSSGVRLPKILPQRDVPLPMAEGEFLALTTSTPPSPNQLVNPSLPMSELSVPAESLMAYSVLLNQRLARIDEVNSHAVSGDLYGQDLLEAVSDISMDLEAWKCALPEHMQNIAGNMEYWTQQGLSTAFVLLHIDFNHFNQLLFYQFLHGSAQRASPFSRTHQYAQKCRHHATELSNLIHLASVTPRAQPLYSLGGHVLAIASTALLHTFLFADNEVEQQSARRLLERNFEFLTTLREYWPCLDVTFSRFEAFHNACMHCRDDSHFRMDQWMLKFMHEFAKPISERRWDTMGEQKTEKWSLASLGLK